MPQDTGRAEVEIDLPLQEVYQLWVRYEDYPLFIAPLAEVAQLSDTVLHWRVEFGGSRRDFDTVITEHVPRCRIAWRSLGPALHRGDVAFELLEERRTRISLSLAWDHRVIDEASPGETATRPLIDDARVAADLRTFVRLVEEDVFESRRRRLIGGSARRQPGVPE